VCSKNPKHKQVRRVQNFGGREGGADEDGCVAPGLKTRSSYLEVYLEQQRRPCNLRLPRQILQIRRQRCPFPLLSATTNHPFPSYCMYSNLI
jgi:hypothetical protein